jgi:N-acetylneuraminate synthase
MPERARVDKISLHSSRCLIIGEVAQAHDGSLGMAHAFIDAIAAAGADAVKFQTHIARAESTPQEPWRVKFSRQDETRYDYWRRMEFSPEQWEGLKRHSVELGLHFLSTPFSLEAMDLLEKVGVPAWKVGSGEASSTPMIDRMIESKLPILLSTGMSPLEEIDEIVDRIKARNAEFALLQCTSAYPCPPEKIGLNMIPFYRGRYGCHVGLSDHSGTIYPGLAAATMGIEVLEVHVALSREMFGPDVVASVTTAELKQLVKGIRFIEKMKANPVDKDGLFSEMKPLRDLFTKSVVALRPLNKGAILLREHLGGKKPGTGIPVEKLDQVVGRRLKRSVQADELLQYSDLEEVE